MRLQGLFQQMCESRNHKVAVEPLNFINPFPPNDAIWRHETFSFMMSHLAMSLGDRLCVSRKAGQGEVGRVWAQLWLEPGRPFLGF